MSYDINDFDDTNAMGAGADASGTAPQARRGYQPTDEKDFGPEAMHVLHRAGSELSYLLDHDYPRETAVEFVGNRYQFTSRQRMFLSRGICGRRRRTTRANTHLEASELRGREVCIDGFNVIVPLEVALVHGPLIHAQDGAIRDLAGISGTYRAVHQTMQAIDLVLDVLSDAGARSATFFFDRPVRNSGRLAKTISDYVRALSSIQPGMPKIQTALVDNVDAELAGREFVATNDSGVIDRVQSWVSLDAEALGRVDDVWMLEALDPEDVDDAPDPGVDLLAADESSFVNAAGNTKPATRVPTIPVSVRDPGDTLFS